MYTCFIFLALVAAVAAQSQTTIDNSNKSLSNAVYKYQVSADRHWYGPNNIIDYFELVTSLRYLMAANISALYADNATLGAIIAAEITAPACPFVADAAFYLANETATLEFLCCHLHHLQHPGLDMLMLQINAHFFDGIQGASVQHSILDALDNMLELRLLDLESLQTGECKADTRIHLAEYREAHAYTISHVLGLIDHAYTLLSSKAAAVLGCMLSPTGDTGCTTSSSPLAIAPNFAMVEHDPFYQSRCGLGALAAFEASRLAVSC